MQVKRTKQGGGEKEEEVSKKKKNDDYINKRYFLNSLPFDNYLGR